jgi:hypothetical protein
MDNPRNAAPTQKPEPGLPFSSVEEFLPPGALHLHLQPPDHLISSTSNSWYSSSHQYASQLWCPAPQAGKGKTEVVIKES